MTKTDQGAEVYDNQIESLFIQYCQDNGWQDQLDKHDIDDSHAYCIWEYIYINLFKPDKNTIRYNNKTSKIDYSDIYAINEILDTYIRLCFNYKIYPLIEDFSTLTGIARDTFYTWERGDYRRGEPGATFKHSDILKKIRDATQRMTVKDLHGNPIGQQSLANNYVGAGLMFTQKEIMAQAEANMISQLSREEIAARYQALPEFRSDPDVVQDVDSL